MELIQLEWTCAQGLLISRWTIAEMCFQWQGRRRHRMHPVVKPSVTGDAFLDRTSLLILADDWFGK